MNTPDSNSGHEQFIALFSANHRRIFGFVVSISPSHADVDEIFQNVSLVLWQKWPQYVEEGKFLAWALQIARFEVVKFMTKQKRRKEIFSDEVLELIQVRTAELTPELNERMTALQDCIQQLPKDQRKLVRQCYSGDFKKKDVATGLGLDAQNLYLRLQRIRKTLHRCVDRSLAKPS